MVFTIDFLSIDLSRVRLMIKAADFISFKQIIISAKFTWQSQVLMSSQIQEKFQKSLVFFQKLQYEDGLHLITQCIDIDPQNADLLINRALFHINLDQTAEAILDLNKAVEIDPHNYVTYFNLASINIKQGDKIEALQNICCSLSCLYLSKGRVTQNKEDVKKAMFYAENNVEAHVLRAFMHLRYGSQKKALRQLDRAFQLDPQNALIQKIRHAVYKQLLPYHNLYSQETTVNASRRLRSTYEPADKESIDQQIQEKTREFNTLLKDLQGKIQGQQKSLKILTEGKDSESNTFEIRQSHL